MCSTRWIWAGLKGPENRVLVVCRRERAVISSSVGGGRACDCLREWDVDVISKKGVKDLEHGESGRRDTQRGGLVSLVHPMKMRGF